MSQQLQLHRSPEMEEERMPIVSLVVVADKNKCPPNFTPITKTHDDGSDADLWKDGFGLFNFNRQVRYLAVSRHITDTHGPLEVLTDLAIISDKEAVPLSFICLDYTVDSKEKALKKKYLCARFTPRNDAVDAVSNIIVLGKTKRPPRNYSSAGEVDGMVICYKVSTIPDGYGRLTHSQSTELSQLGGPQHIPGPGLYPSVNRHSAGDLDRIGQQQPQAEKASSQQIFRGIDRVPFVLNPVFAIALARNDLSSALPPIPDWRALEAKHQPKYVCTVERALVSQPVTPSSPPAMPF